MYDADKQKGIRSVLRLAYDPEEDNQGRIVLTEKLRSFAGIEKDIVFLGVGNRIEIWNQKEYDKYYENEDFNSVVTSLIK
jgi:MraZ protein